MKTTCPVLDFTGPPRESIEARIRILEDEALREFTTADVLAGYADDHRQLAERKQAEADRQRALLAEQS